MSRLLLDAHSHLHPQFPLRDYLDGAWASFSRRASARKISSWQGCLLVAETEAAHVRNRLQRATEDAGTAGEWKLMPTDERVSRIAQHTDGRRIFLVLGRQIRTTDGFEVLQAGALQDWSGTAADVRTQVARVREQGAYPILPWGFGKWSFGRREILLECLDGWEPRHVALADSALRPRIFAGHPVLAVARQRGFPVLAGTDPLPFPSHARRSGRYATTMDLELPLDRPWARLRAALENPDGVPALAGRRDGLVESLWNQARLRIRGPGTP